MVVGIANVELVLLVDDGVGIALEMQAGIARVDQDTTEIDKLALDPKDLAENLR